MEELGQFLLRIGLFAAAAGSGFEEAGFVNDARKVFNNTGASEFLGFGDANKGNVGAFEELFHVFGVAAGVFFVIFFFFVDFDGADGAKGALVAEDEIDGFVLDETVGFVAALGADFVAEERIKADAGDDIKFLAKKFIEKLETLTFGANHEMLAGAIAATLHGFALATTNGDASERGDQKERQRRKRGAGKIDFVRCEKVFDLHRRKL